MKQLTALNGIHTVSLKGGTFEEERRCTLCEVHTVHFLERLCPSGKAVSCCTQPGASRWTFLSEVDPSCCKYLCRFRNGRAAWGMHHCHCRAELHSEDFRNHLRSIWIYHVHERQKRISTVRLYAAATALLVWHSRPKMSMNLRLSVCHNYRHCIRVPMKQFVPCIYMRARTI